MLEISPQYQDALSQQKKEPDQGNRLLLSPISLSHMFASAEDWPHHHPRSTLTHTHCLHCLSHFLALSKSKENAPFLTFLKLHQAVSIPRMSFSDLLKDELEP